ncbi:hypothetical protein GX51_07786 [Blastomyces parvus]|uniref:Uncharacterized protein n=1 Tax=Blastomyces parvus TaxID=2060905 RepID=A0A2B7WIP6_9EURO|nr:hypothetical protein GX51_07786 [Blastomyces parvus]
MIKELNEFEAYKADRGHAIATGVPNSTHGHAAAQWPPPPKSKRRPKDTRSFEAVELGRIKMRMHGGGYFYITTTNLRAKNIAFKEDVLPISKDKLPMSYLAALFGSSAGSEWA